MEISKEEKERRLKEYDRIGKEIMKPEYLPEGSPDITDPNEIMAIKEGYRNYAQYQRDIEAVIKMRKINR